MTTTKSSNLADNLKNISANDRKQIEAAQEMLGPDPATMGVTKNTFWGTFREDLLFPYPKSAQEETQRCNELLARLDTYLQTEHPTHEIDPVWGRGT